MSTALLFPACDRQRGQPAEQSPPPVGTAAASERAVPSSAAPDDGQWLQPAGDYAATRYSPLDQIRSGNVATLKLAFTFSTGFNKGHEAAPLVVGKTMYVVTPFPNVLYALDLSQSGAPEKWSYKPNPLPAAQGVACCDVVNRGAVYSDGKIYYNTLDGQTVAVDADSGPDFGSLPVSTREMTRPRDRERPSARDGPRETTPGSAE